MTEQQNKNQKEVVEWQPDEAIVFDSEDSQANLPKKKKTVSEPQSNDSQVQPVENAGCCLNTKQVLALKALTKRLETLVGELKQAVQAFGFDRPEIDQAIEQNKLPDCSGDDIGTVIEGYFDGEKMIAASGQTYLVPANYASKSKLVEGDNLKLTIGSNGHFVYKQISPVERRRLIANLEQAPDGNYYAVFEHQRWRLLQASISYFHAQTGDKIAILIPSGATANYAALENLVAE
jgi:antitoxin component of MazEF toxin-antitoxin module